MYGEKPGGGLFKTYLNILCFGRGGTKENRIQRSHIANLEFHLFCMYNNYYILPSSSGR
jgi:hypothetical protein